MGANESLTSVAFPNPRSVRAWEPSPSWELLRAGVSARGKPILLSSHAACETMEEGTKTKKTIYVGGLADDVNEDVLLETFAPFG